MKLRAEGDCILVDVLVQPRASRVRIGPVVSDRLKVTVTAPPVDGEANRAVTDVVAGALGIARGQVEVARGDGSRRKTLRIRGASPRAIERLAAGWPEPRR